MFKYIAALLLLLAPCVNAQRATFYGQNRNNSAPPGGITFVQEVIAVRNPSSVTTPSITCTAGHFLYIYAGTYTSVDGFTVTNTTGDTVTSVVSNKPASNTSSQVFKVSSCTGTPGTFTLTDSNGSYLDFAVLEFSGVTGVDSTNTCAAGGWTAGCAVSTTSTNTYVISSMQTNSLGPINLATSWTSYQSTLDHGATLQGLVSHSSGVVSWAPLNGTNGGGTSDTEIIVALN